MKRIFLIILLFMMLAGIGHAALTYDSDYFLNNISNMLSQSTTDNPIYLHFEEVTGILEGSSAISTVYFTGDVPSSLSEGMFWYNTGSKSLQLRTDAATVDIDVAGASSLAAAYVIGQKITLTSANTLEIEAPDDIVSSGPMLLLDCDEDTDNIAVLQITDAGAGICIDIDGTTGDDIQGTADSWAVDYAGYGTFVGLLVGAEDLELENGAEIQNVVDTEIRFIEGSGAGDEDFIFDFQANVIAFKSGTSVVAIDFGDVDALSGINAIAFDAAAANTITQTGSNDTYDLTISQAGTADCSLILQSAGSITDALSLRTTDAEGVIKISSSDVLDIDAVDDITIDTSNGTYTLTIGGASDGKYIMTAADTMSMISVDSATIQTTAAQADITMNSVLGSIFIKAEENIANAVTITADGGTSSTLKLHNDTGIAATSIYLLSDVGGITATASSGGIYLNATGAASGDWTAVAGDVMTFTSADTKIFDGATIEKWVIEGAANAHETTLQFTAPAADVTYVFPTAAAQTVAVMSSTLATNAPHIASSVWGGSNQIIAEGTTANGSETTIAFSDVGADQTITIPDGSSGKLLVPSYKAFTANATIEATRCYGGVFTNAGAAAAIELEMPSAVAGMQFTMFLTVACDVDLDAASGDTILHLTDTAADSISSEATVGSRVTLFAIDANSWIPIASSGYWTDAGA